MEKASSPMTERVHIRPRYREEFEQLAGFELRKRLEAGLYDAEKQKQGWAWLDEQAHGEEREYRARQLALQVRNDWRGNISVGIALAALAISALALYRSGSQNVSPSP